MKLLVTVWKEKAAALIADRHGDVYGHESILDKFTTRSMKVFNV